MFTSAFNTVKWKIKCTHTANPRIIWLPLLELQHIEGAQFVVFRAFIITSKASPCHVHRNIAGKSQNKTNVEHKCSGNHFWHVKELWTGQNARAKKMFTECLKSYPCCLFSEELNMVFAFENVSSKNTSFFTSWWRAANWGQAIHCRSVRLICYWLVSPSKSQEQNKNTKKKRSKIQKRRVSSFAFKLY